MMDLWTIATYSILGLVGVALFFVLCLVLFLLPTPSQLSLSRRIINKKTGKPLSNNNFKFPLGDLGRSLQNFREGEGWRLKFVPEGACGWWALKNYDVQLLNADWLKELLSIPDIKFNRSLADFKVLNRLLGTSLLGCGGEDWNRMHKILYKAFSPTNLQNFVPIFVSQTKLLSQSINDAIATNKSIDMFLAFNVLTLDVMVDAGFGDTVTPEDKQVILTAFRYLFAETQNPLHDIPILNALPFPSNLKVERQFRKLLKLADRFVLERRAAHEQGRSLGVHEGKYVIDLLLEARDQEEEGGMSDLEVRDNVVMLLLAGSETTGTTLTWVIYHLATQPEVYAKVMEENAALDLSWDSVSFKNFDKELPVLTSVIKESLRITPAISGIPQRIFTEPGTIGDLELPTGSRVGAAQWNMHRNPDYWTDPEKFDISRFDEDQVRARHRYSYIPFGEGRRQCLGKTFAMNEMRVIFSLLLRYYTFTYDTSAGPVEMLWRPPTIAPKNGMPMFFKHREQSTTTTSSS